MKHVRYSPSKLELYECCPSFFQEQTITLNPAAEEGNLLHKAVETNEVSILEHEEQVDLFNRCKIVEGQIIAKYTNPKIQTKVLREQFVTLTDLTQGTLDLMVIEELKADIVDWKFGKIPVTKAETNIQGQAYSAAVLETYPSLKEVTVSIYQPRLDLLTSATYTRDDLERIRLRILSIIARANGKTKDETPSEKACSYCDRKGDCHALKAIACKAGEGMGLQMPGAWNIEGYTKPADLAKLQIISQIVEDWATQVRKRNTKRVIEDGVEIPGFEIRSREGKKSVTDLVSAAKLISSKFSVGIDSFLMACDVSLPKLTDQVVAVKGGKKADLRKEIEDEISAYLVQGEQITYLQKKKGMTYEDIIKECSG